MLLRHKNIYKKITFAQIVFTIAVPLLIFAVGAGVSFVVKAEDQAMHSSQNNMPGNVTIASLDTQPPVDKNEELRQKKIQKEQELKQLNQKIQEYQGFIKQKMQEGASLKNEIALYNIEIKSTEIQIQATKTNIDNTHLQIQQTQNQIAVKNQQIADEKNLLAKLITNLNAYDNASALQLGLGSNNFSELLDQMKYTESLQSKIFSILQQIKELKAKLERDEKELQKSLQKLEQLNEQLKQTEITLDQQRESKLELLDQTRGQESRYKKLLITSQSEEDRIYREIYELDNLIRGKKGFKSLRPIHGILAWPIDGVVTQGYGNTGFTKLGYNFHNGIDIAAPAGTPIYAAANGVVIATGRGEAAYGNWVAVKHKISSANGHEIVTLYAHMSNFVASAGQNMKQGDLVGYEGNSGNTTRLLYGPDRGYHLHFGVFDSVDFQINDGKYPEIFRPYKVPYGYTYNPMDFL